MARQRGKRWMADVTDGEGVRHRPTFQTAQEAAAWERRAHTCIEEGFPVPDKEASTVPLFKDFSKRCLKTIWGGVKAMNTKVSMVSVLTRELGPLRRLDRITSKDMVDFTVRMMEANKTSGTINIYIGMFNQIMRQAVVEGVEFPGGKTPAVSRVPHRPGRRIREVSHDELTQLVQLLDAYGKPRMAKLMTFLRWVGCRKGEALGVPWSNFHGSRVTFMDTKNGKDRTVTLLKPAADVVNSLRGNGLAGPFWGINVYTLAHYFNKAKAEMGLAGDKDFVIHTLRHTSCSHQARSNVALARIQKWHGHENIASTMIYAHLLPEDLDDVAATLGMDIGSVPKTVP